MEEQWLEVMYGSKSTLMNEEWVERVTSVGKWIFDAAELRHRLFGAARMIEKHLE